MPDGTIIIAAHNEEAVIGRTLSALEEILASGEAKVIVACNGCSDDTFEVARQYSGVDALDLSVASKTAALRAGDRHAGPGPRIYLDADIVLTAHAARDVIAALSKDTALAGRPPHRFDASRASSLVRRWYRVRGALPSISSALWGAGCYALSPAGRARFDEFPDVVSDDLFIDSLFREGEVAIIDTEPLVVTTPRRVADLIRILRRSYRTQPEVAPRSGGISAGQKGQLHDIVALLRERPTRIIDVCVYLLIVLYSRVLARFSRSTSAWERDSSSREQS